MAATPITVTGQLTTKSNGTGGSIELLSPANISGAGGGILNISFFSMTCAGAAQTGQTFMANKTPLTASSTTACTTYAAGYDSTLLGGVNFTLSLFLDDRTLDDDSFPATNFTVVATAT